MQTEVTGSEVAVRLLLSFAAGVILGANRSEHGHPALGAKASRTSMHRRAWFFQKAGDEGVAVKDLAAALGVKSQNIHVWFSSTGRIKGLTKV